MVTIANCRDWHQTQILKSRLESAGISVFVPDEMSNLDGLILHFGGFRVQVAEEDAAAASALVKSSEDSSKPTEPGTAPDGGPAEPR